jgi:hypothetical protein
MSLTAGLLTMLPAIVLAVVMLVRPYLGERAIHRLRARLARPRICARRAYAPCKPRSRTALTARGGLLIAASLAGRAPPRALAGCR